MNKIQLTFTSQEADILSQKASLLGYSLTKYIKLLLGREVLSAIEYPTFNLSKKAVGKIDTAFEEYKSGRASKLENIDDLDSL